MTYSPQLFEPLTFFDMTPRFRDGSDTPRAYLERCLAVIADREPVVQAWVVLNLIGSTRGGRRLYRALSPGAPDLVHRRYADRHQGPDRDKGHADRAWLRGFCRESYATGLGDRAGFA